MLRRSPEEKAQKEAEKAEKKAAAQARGAELLAEWDRGRAERDRERTAKRQAEIEALLVEGETIEGVGRNTILTNKRIIQDKSRSIPYRSIVAVDSTMLSGLRVSFGDGRESLADSNMTSRRPEFTFKSKEDRDAAKQIILSHMLTPDTTESA